MCCCLCLPVCVVHRFLRCLHIHMAVVWSRGSSSTVFLSRPFPSWRNFTNTPSSLFRSVWEGGMWVLWDVSRLLLCIRKAPGSLFGTAAVVLLGSSEHGNSAPEEEWEGRWQTRNASPLIVLAMCTYPAGIKVVVTSPFEKDLKYWMGACPNASLQKLQCK